MRRHQEHSAGADAIRAVEPVDDAATFATPDGVNPPSRRETRREPPESAKSWKIEIDPAL